MSTCLVTGAEGFIGSHLVSQLLADGWQVKAMVHYNSFGRLGWLADLPSEAFTQIEILPGDIQDQTIVSKAMEQVEVVFHLAALISIPYSYQAPRSYLSVNASGTLNVLEAAKQHEVEHVLITSTSEVYGTAKYVPIDEQHPLQAQSPYSASKIAAEAMAMAYFRSFDVPVTILRPFNTYGPRQSNRAVIPAIISQLLRKPAQLKLGDLRPTRDFTYVTDTARAISALANCQASLGQAVNIASGQEMTIGTLAQHLIRLLHPQTAIVQDPSRMRPPDSEVFRLCGDTSKLQSMIDWEPHYSLEAGLHATIEWFSDPDNLAHYPDKWWFV